MISLSRALLVVRALVPGSIDPEAGDYDPGAGGPVVPGGWSSFAQGSTGWYELTAPSGFRVFAYRTNTDPGGTRGLFAVLGRPEELATIEAAADLALPAVEAWRRRAEAGVLPYLRSWRTFECAGFERAVDLDGNPAVRAFSGVRTIVDEGGRLPDYTVDALPWDLAADGSLTTQALAVYRITSITRPALGITLAGLGCHELFRDEPDTGA